MESSAVGVHVEFPVDGMSPVGEEDVCSASLRVDPEGDAGEARVPDGAIR